ncbi:hypothetical protein CBC_0335 [Clostridium botulinum C str. Eklund]|nr:hypothetical protein CBC_0335 [Clostridium botulinum C str. Eklund]
MSTKKVLGVTQNMKKNEAMSLKQESRKDIIKELKRFKIFRRRY